jgi:hypothetical protein
MSSTPENDVVELDVSNGRTAVLGAGVLSSGEFKAGGVVVPLALGVGGTPDPAAALKGCHSRDMPPPSDGRRDLSSDAAVDAASHWRAATDLGASTVDGFCG